MIQTNRLYSADDLYMLRQGEEEPLQEYAARSSHEYSRYPETDDRATFGAFKSGLRKSNFRYLVHSNPWNTYVELMKQAAVHAKAKYFNSKRGPATFTRSTFGDLPPASVPTLAPPQRSIPIPALDNQGTPHPKRKDSYQHTFSSSKRGRHGNHHQINGSNPPMRMSWYMRHLSYPSLPSGDRPTSLCQTQVSSAISISSVATIPNLVLPCATSLNDLFVRGSWINMCTTSHPHLTLTKGRST
ncbi:unnamed protein product [Prunus armeniaca]